MARPPFTDHASELLEPCPAAWRTELSTGSSWVPRGVAGHRAPFGTLRLAPLAMPVDAGAVADGPVWDAAADQPEPRPNLLPMSGWHAVWHTEQRVPRHPGQDQRAAHVTTPVHRGALGNTPLGSGVQRMTRIDNTAGVSSGRSSRQCRVPGLYTTQSRIMNRLKNQSFFFES